MLERSLRRFPSSVAERWVEELPQRLIDAEERWSISIGRPFEPGGVTSFVAPAIGSDGSRLVYKITVPHDEAAGEDDALAAYRGDGVVRVAASCPAGFELLLERADPGADLWTVDDDRARLEVACELARRLWRAEPPPTMRTVDTTARSWADITERRLITAELPWITGPIERGIDLLRSLPGDTGLRVLLHGDFHPGNILSAEREPWLVIDPKPLVGDPAFEPIQLLAQRSGRIVEPPTAAAVEARVTTIADLLGLDAGRIARWGLARCAEWSMWSWEHGDTIDAAIAYTWARILDQLA